MFESWNQIFVVLDSADIIEDEISEICIEVDEEDDRGNKPKDGFSFELHFFVRARP
jgi:hypothetical protein